MEREAYLEHTPPSVTWEVMDVPVVVVYDPKRKRKPQAAPPNAAGERFIHAIEFLEDFFHIPQRYADAAVFDIG
jgi:hypothetical protein